MILHQKLKEIAERAGKLKDFTNPKQDIPRLVKALEACREQRNIIIGLHHGAYAGAINKITGMFDEKLEAILEGGENGI